MKASKTQIKRLIELDCDTRALDDLFKNILDNVKQQKSEIHSLRKTIWDEIHEQYDLDNGVTLKVNHRTGEVTVIDAPPRQKLAFNQDTGERQ